MNDDLRPGISILLDGDGAWPDLEEKRHMIREFNHFSLAALRGGMQSGLPSVAIRVDLPDGQIIFIQTSLRVWMTATKALVARYGDPTLEDPPMKTVSPP